MPLCADDKRRHVDWHVVWLTGCVEGWRGDAASCIDMHVMCMLHVCSLIRLAPVKHESVCEWRDVCSRACRARDVSYTCSQTASISPHMHVSRPRARMMSLHSHLLACTIRCTRTCMCMCGSHVISLSTHTVRGILLPYRRVVKQHTRTHTYTSHHTQPQLQPQSHSHHSTMTLTAPHPSPPGELQQHAACTCTHMHMRDTSLYVITPIDHEPAVLEQSP